MKRTIAVFLVLTAAFASAAVTSEHSAPATAGEGTQIALTWTKHIDGGTDGRQTGQVTPVITGPGATTLATKPYDFATLLDPESRTLTWTWTTTQPGTHQIHFDDSITEGTETDEFATIEVEPETLPAPAWTPPIQAHRQDGSLDGGNWGGWTAASASSLESNFLKLVNGGEEDQIWHVQFLDDQLTTKTGYSIALEDNLRFRSYRGPTPGATSPHVTTDLAATFTVPPGTTWLQYEVFETPQDITTSQYTAPFSLTNLR
ncbi:MAG: hypothetical protein ACPHK8_06960 [Thermoplasmatota archaeon]